MKRFGDADIRQTIKNALDGNPRLESGERGPGTCVHTAAECEVITNARAIDVELPGIRKMLRIVVRGQQADRHDGACGHIDIGNFRGRLGQPEIDLDRRIEAQCFLDEVRDAVALLSQALLQCSRLKNPMQDLTAMAWPCGGPQCG